MGPASGDPARGVAGIVLAAGRSARMPGAFKLLLPYGDRSVIGRVVEVAAAAGLDPLLVVVGHREAELRRELRDAPVRLVENPRYGEGQATSVAAGVAALEGDPGVEAAVLLLGDEPGLRTAAVRAVVREWERSRAAAVRAVYLERLGHPVLFARALFPRLRALRGDAGASALLARMEARGDAVRHVRIEGPAPVDVDTPATYREALERMR